VRGPVGAAAHAYKLLLLQSYRFGDLSQVSPLARGSAPLLVAAFAALVVGERLAPVQLAGLLGVCAGLGLLLEVGRAELRRVPAVGFALATGVAIAAYTVVDGLGVRRAGSELGYIAWLFLVDGLPIPLLAAASRRRELAGRLRGRLGVGVVSGCCRWPPTGWCCGPSAAAPWPWWPPCARPACWPRP
jgi:drug/metabolite transporter (DMT)-like permease